MRNARAVIIGLVLALLVVGAYYTFKIRPRLKAIEGEFDQPTASKPQTFNIQETVDGDFDRTVDLPGNPIGIAINGEELLIGNGMDPWGFLRARRAAPDSFEIQKLAVIETTYGQQMSFDSVTWNGQEYVGVTSESWFQQGDGSVFTIHDPRTLAVKTFHQAPKLVGCIAWTGESYWAASRLNTADSSEAAVLYHLDKSFQQIGRFDSPGKGCQGLAWDGNYLWFVDVFSDQIHVLDISGEVPTTLQSLNSPYSYLSGIAYDGSDIWISEYDRKQLHRLSPSIRASWKSPSPAELPTFGPQIVQVEPPQEEKTSDSYTNSFPDTGSEDMDVLEFKIESRGNAIYGSFEIFCGEDLFTPNQPAGASSEISMPTFVRYTTYTEGGDLAVPIQYEYDATPGENVRNDMDLATNLNPGTYSVHIFLHAQFVDKNGTNRILNSSGPTLTVSVK